MLLRNTTVLKQAVSNVSKYNNNIIQPTVHSTVKQMIYDMIDHSWDYNCWGFTSLLFGWISETKWLADYKILNFLDVNTVEIGKKQIKTGDIIVFYNYGIIQHTGVFYKTYKHNNIKKFKILHKPGSGSICIETLSEINDMYTNYGTTYKFRRVN